jgi:hypothetical protein
MIRNLPIQWLRVLFVLQLMLLVPGCEAPDANIVYFPKDAREEFAFALRRMKEPSLYEQTASQSFEQYRFLWLRSFDKPIAIRAFRDASGAKLRVVRLNCEGGVDGRIDYERVFNLTDEEWKKLLKALEHTSFWTMPTKESVFGLDGADWILEGRSAERYHCVVRWSPKSHGDERELNAYREACLYLLTLSKIEIPQNRIY